MSKNNPLVSVVMPVYNGEKFLKEAIESILNQTYLNFEFIIVDDGSIDKSWEIIREYQKKDRRIRVFKNKENRGNFFSRNRGLRESKGEYYAVMDADDISCIDRLEKQVDFLERNKNFSIVGSQIEIIDKIGDRVGSRNYPIEDSKVKREIMKYSPFAHPTVVIRKEMLEGVGLYDGYFKVAGDYDLYFRLLEEGKGYNLGESLLLYRISESQLKSVKLKETLENTIKIQKKARKEYGYEWSFLDYINFMIGNFVLILPDNLTFFIFKIYRYSKKN